MTASAGPPLLPCDGPGTRASAPRSVPRWLGSCGFGVDLGVSDFGCRAQGFACRARVDRALGFGFRARGFFAGFMVYACMGRRRV